MADTARHFREWLNATKSQRRILLVEDNEAECFLMLDLSRSFCIDWCVAHNYAEAVEEFHKHAPFRLVILDLDFKSMPDGVAFYRWIKSEYPSAAVLVFSGHISDKIMSEMMDDHHFLMFTPKPRSYTPEFFKQMFQALAIPLPLPDAKTKTTDTSEITI